MSPVLVRNVFILLVGACHLLSIPAASEVQPKAEPELRGVWITRKRSTCIVKSIAGFKVMVRIICRPGMARGQGFPLRRAVESR